jgi:hypothetical protein
MYSAELHTFFKALDDLRKAYLQSQRIELESNVLLPPINTLQGMTNVIPDERSAYLKTSLRHLQDAWRLLEEGEAAHQISHILFESLQLLEEFKKAECYNKGGRYYETLKDQSHRPA